MNYEVILDRLNEGCKIVGFDWRYLYLNDAACRHARRGRDELLGKRVMEVFPGIEDTEIFGRMSACMNDRRADSTETWFSYPDGKSSFLHINIHPVDEGILVISNEVTERKLVEEALLESEERYRGLFETETDAILLLDMGTLKFVEANLAARHLYGYTLEEFQSLGVEDISAEPEKSLLAIKSRRLMVSSHLHRKKDGSTFPVEIAGSFYEYKGSMIHVAAIRDIGTRIRRELVMDARYQLLRFAHARSLDGTLQLTLDKAEELTGSCIGFFHFVEPDQKSVSLQTWSTKTKEFFCNTQKPAHHHAISEAGVWVDCIRYRRPVIHNHYASLPNSKGFPQGHPEVVRELVAPIFRHGKIVAILGVGNKETLYSYQDVEDVSLLADLAWEIIERKLAEEALQKSELSLKEAQEIARMGRWELDLVTGHLLWSHGIYDLFEIDPNAFDASYGAFLELVHPDDRNLVDSVYRQTVENKGDYAIEHRLLMSDGRIKWVSVIGRTEYDKDGHPLRSIGTFQDITERKRAEESLNDSEERYRRLFETDTNAIIMADQETLRIIDVNPAAEKMYGYSHGEFLKLTTPDASAEPKKSRKALAEKQRWIPLRKHRKKDGTLFPVEVSVSYFLYQGREVNVAAIRDISERKRLEEEARISQAKLIQANKMASLGLLASGVTHEISNPNNYILNNLSMLADAWQSSLPILEEYYRENGEFQLGDLPFSQLRDMAPRLFSGTVEGAQRIGSIIDKLKNFVRQDYGTSSVSFDINYVVSGALEMINSEIRKRCDNFSMETCPELPHAYGNPQQIGQVIVNLVLNALQSLPGRGHGVKVRTGMTDQGKNLYITVSDEGLGIPDDIIDHITEPFFTTRGDQGGSGLGLYISDSILRDNRGHLSFISNSGKGTIATVLLEVFMHAEDKGT